jgi:internalin A
LNAAHSNGLLKRRDLATLLKASLYPNPTHQFIVDVMQKFELCFEVSKGESWLIPELLPENEPEGLDVPADALRFQYHYEVLPAGIICRFIVRRFENLIQPPIYWRSGVVLEFDGCTAIIRSDKDKGRMFISVSGPEGRRRCPVRASAHP